MATNNEDLLKNTLYVVTEISEYSVRSMFIFTDNLQAERKFISIYNSNFGDDHHADTIDAAMDYLQSEDWWDNDFRTSISLDTIYGVR